jgi:hypothetical protein
MTAQRADDPALFAVIKALYGDAVDPREVADLCKAGGQAQRERRQAQVGLASNALGITAGVAGLKEVAGREAFRTGGRIGRTVHRASEGAGKVPGLNRVGRLVATHPRGAAAGALSLQAANLAGDAVANRVLARASKERVRKAAGGRLDPVSKGYRRAVRMTEHLASAQHRSFVEGMRTEAMKQPFMGRTGRRVPSHAARPAAGRHAGPARINGRLVALSGGSAAAGSAATLAATRRRNPVGKSHVDLVFDGLISKVDTEKRLVFGWCSLSVVDGQPVIDRQGDFVPLDEIEKSAYRYVRESRKGGDMHRRVAKFADGGPVHTADLIESFVVTPEKLEKMGLSADALPHGWWVGYKVNDDEQWAAVKAGKRLGFSIHGTGVRKELA